MRLKLPSGVGRIPVDSARGRKLLENLPPGPAPSLLLGYNQGADGLSVLSFIAASVLFLSMVVILGEAWPVLPSWENAAFALFLLVVAVYYFTGFWRERRWYALFDDKLCSSAGTFAREDIADIDISRTLHSFRHAQFGICLVMRDGKRHVIAGRDVNLERVKCLANEMRAWLGMEPWSPPGPPV